MSTDWLADDAHKLFKKHLADLEAAVDLNEATTRLRVIDTLLFEVLHWDKAMVETEKYTRDVGYLDYIFSASTAHALVLEAKKDEIIFVLPENKYPPEPVPFSLIAKESPAAASAVRQALGYANSFGATYTAITNGQQWLMTLTFVANESVEDRLVFVFESLDAINNKFRTFYECFSSQAIKTHLPSLRLLDIRRAPAPPKLSSKVAGYPLLAERNKVVNAMRGVLQLVWDEANFDPNNELFLQHCYIVAEPAADLLRVARELLQQRSATDENLAAANTASADKKAILEARLEYERPVVILGRIGNGKSTFLKYLRYIEAKDLLKNKYIQLDLDFLDQPATAEAVPGFILDQVEAQLRTIYQIDVTADDVVRHALRQDLKDFHASPRGKLLSKPGREAELADAEVDFIETFTKDREKYFARLFKHIRRGQGKSIAIFFDNLDRRLDQIQEQAFLRASAIASAWSSLVFVCLRPSTVKRSQSRGILDTIAPRIITVGPPQTVPMLRKRFQYASQYARKTLPKEAYARGAFANDIEKTLPQAADLLDVCDQSLFRKPSLGQQYEAVANGNVRLIVNYVRGMLTSNYFNSEFILKKIKDDEEYLLSEHETLQSLILGQYIHYEPNESLFLNLFHIRRADPSEHFSRLFLLDFCHRQADAEEKFGFIGVETIHTYMSSLGYSFDHIKETLDAAFAKKCIEGRDYDEETTILGDEIRITSLGSYHIAKLIRKFVYLDAMIIDTPILDDNVRPQIQDVRQLKDRIERARTFLRYLDHSSETMMQGDARRLWADVSNALAHNITDVEKGAPSNAGN